MRLDALTCAVGLLAVAVAAHAQERALQPPSGDGELRRGILAQLLDGRYRLALRGDEETLIRFHGGRGAIKYGDGATERVQAGLVDDLVAFGDLDGDLIADAAVVIFIDPGGSGTFIHLLAMRDREGTAVQVAREFLGDRVLVESIAISGGRIFLTMLVHGPDDGMCCPSAKVHRAFKLDGHRLVESTSR